MRKISWILVLMLVTVLAGSVFAQGVDDQGNPNDPTVNEYANACFEGGAFEGICGDNDILWIAGWYQIRYEYGLIGASEINALFSWLGIEAPVEIAAVDGSTFPSAGCISFGKGYSDFGGGYFLYNPSAYTDPSCSTFVGFFGGTFVYAPAPFSPVALCDSVLLGSSAIPVVGDTSV